VILLVGLGLIRLFDAVPLSHTVLQSVGIGYLLWLAWKIANADMPEAGKSSRPMNFVQAAAFQWVNPKAWQMALTAITLYAPDRSIWAIGFVSLVFGLINLPSVSTWTVLGQQMQRVLSSPLRLRSFNIFMAVLLVASVIPVLYSAQP